MATGAIFIVGIASGGVIGYLIGFQRGFNKGKEHMIEKKRRYDKSR